MPRRITLRQVEAFKAVIEKGSVSNAAQLMHISQPAMSKLIAHFEADTGIKLFNRIKGRLAPTSYGMRLYQEIDRIFAGVRQIENAAEAIRREERGRLAVGVMPALSAAFIQRATMSFLNDHPNVFCVVQSLASPWTLEQLGAGTLDVGLVGVGYDNPCLTLEPLMEYPLVCIMPLNHPLAAKNLIEPKDLNRLPFISFQPDSHTGRRVNEMFATYGVKAQIAMFANMAPTLREFVAAGLGVSLIHPLMISGLEERLVVRRFEPKIPYTFHLCYKTDSRNAELVEAYSVKVRDTAEKIARAMFRESQITN